MAQEFEPTSLTAALMQVHGSALEAALNALDHESGLVVSLRDAGGRLLYLNEGTRRVFGLGDMTVTGRVSLGGSRYFLPNGREIPLIDHPAQVTARSGLPQTNVIFAIERPEHPRRWVRMSFLPFHRNERGWTVLGVGCEVTDLYEDAQTKTDESS